VAKIAALIDAFTASTAINLGVWSSSSIGQFTLDTVNDVVLLNVGTTPGTFNSASARVGTTPQTPACTRRSPCRRTATAAPS
jgi:hypothetical protein